MNDYNEVRENSKRPVPSKLLWLIWQGAVALVLLLNIPISEAFAQSVQASLRCPKKPLNIRLYQDVLARQVQLGIDPDVYSNVRVNVRLRQTGRTKNRTSVSGTDILNGLTITQDGLLTTLSGGVSYTSTCDFPFVARVKIRATDIATGTRLASSTESIVTITSAGEFVSRAIRIVASPTPTPTATATATPTPS